MKGVAMKQSALHPFTRYPENPILSREDVP